jgi:hypothetical protein
MTPAPPRERRGIYSCIGRSLDRSPSIFALANRPDVNLSELANTVLAVYRQ